MSTSEQRMNLHTATRIASNFVRDIEDVCERIEIVVIPKREPNLLGEPGDSLLDLLLDELLANGTITPGGKRGPKQCRLEIPNLITGSPERIGVDLFITDPERWASTLVIRTGPSQTSHWLVTRRCHGGAMPDDMRQHDGRLWRGVVRGTEVKFEEGMGEFNAETIIDPGVPIDTPDEATFFQAIGLPLVPPNQRAELITIQPKE